MIDRHFVTLLLCYLLFSGIPSFSQYYISGQDPASINWKQISTEKCRIVYPEASERQAQYLANVMDLLTRTEGHSLPGRVPRIPVVLHSESVISNGVTVWAPRRIELYPCPPREVYPEEWLEQLAIHEYRHAIQISNINQGFSRTLSYIFGEQITGGLLGLFIPTWFLEGDATVTETAVTSTGRGRSPRFESDLRSQVLEKGILPYDQAALGSYRRYIPDSYTLGYYLVGQARIKYGPALWEEAMDRVGKYPFMVVPFNSGIRKKSGLWKKGLYKESLVALDSAWKKQRVLTPVTELRPITHRDAASHTGYYHPIPLNDTILVAEKSSLDQVPQFVRINRITGEEKTILIPGTYHERSLSAGSHFLAWSAPVPDTRWGNRSYSVIRL
ncbi:MAG TPA: hypothetical protein PKG48_10475, partial [Bacteroidales bacterium]|nr:hypothetical protein [Bacteroidales bacterium]